MALKDVSIRNSKPTDRPYRLHDSGGLYLEVTPATSRLPKGGRYWRMSYRYGGKRKLLAIGTYSDVSLAAARGRRDDARKLLTAGLDPSAAKRAEKRDTRERVANTFKAIAEEWLAGHGARLVEGSRVRLERLLKNDILPGIGRVFMRVEF